MRFSKNRQSRPAMLILALCVLASFSVAVARVAADEKADAKLVIKKAVYGDLPDGKSIDVTQKLKDAVKDGALSIDGSNDNFSDPAEGVAKKLKVDYTFEGKDKSKTVDEGQTLTISATGE